MTVNKYDSNKRLKGSHKHLTQSDVVFMRGIFICFKCSVQEIQIASTSRRILDAYFFRDKKSISQNYTSLKESRKIRRTNLREEKLKFNVKEIKTSNL